MRIAVIGGIGAGKSYVCHLLEQRGIEIFYCDTEAKTIMATHPEVRAALTALVGPEVYNAQGLDKGVMGSFLRADPANTAKVNAIVHPRVAETFLLSRKEWMECAILNESGFRKFVDFVVVVTCPQEERIRRVMARNHCDRATVLRWLALQESDEERLKSADFQICNDGITPLEPQVSALLHHILTHS